jgi:hypothetical protein
MGCELPLCADKVETANPIRYVTSDEPRRRGVVVERSHARVRRHLRCTTPCSHS